MADKFDAIIKPMPERNPAMVSRPWPPIAASRAEMPGKMLARHAVTRFDPANLNLWTGQYERLAVVTPFSGHR